MCLRIRAMDVCNPAGGARDETAIGRLRPGRRRVAGCFAARASAATEPADAAGSAQVSGGGASGAAESFDVVIVGAGSAGCALAEGLSADPNLSVLLLEAGGDDRRFWIKMPIGYGACYHDARVNWRFRTDVEPGLAGRTDYWPRGKVLGGSSSINALVYCRGLPDDYNDWRAAGNVGWGWDDVEPAFRAMESRGPGAPAAGAAVSVAEREDECHPIRHIFYDAADEIGLPRTTSMNGEAPEGVCAYEITTRFGLRCSSADAFLRPAMRRPNLTVRTRAHATRVLFEGRRAVGVDYRVGRRRTGGEMRTATARGAVVLCAGAIGSPQLLQLSGVGPADRLAELGVDGVLACGGVGGALQDHLGVSYLYRASLPTLNQVLGTWAGRMAAGARYLATRGGPLSLSVNQIGGMVRSAPDAPRPDIQLYFNPLSYSVSHDTERRLIQPDRHPGFALGFNSCRPTSLGRVDAVSPDPDAPPRIQANYLDTDADVQSAVAGARLIGRLHDTSSMRRLIEGAPSMALSTISDDEILADIRARAGSVYHPCGTCRMAPEHDGGVVDPRLRVYGLEGLRVADAAIFPNVTSANTNAPSMMVGRRAAQLIREDLRGGAPS